MYTIYVKFICFDNKREEFIKKAHKTGVLEAVRNENGCIKYDYYLSENDDNELLLIEFWESKQHQQIHLTQPHMDTLRSFKDDYIKSTEIKEITIK